MTLERFSEIFALLAVQLRFTDADVATIRGYYEALKDLEPEFVAMAAERFGATADWFPKTSEWRAMAARIEVERTELVKARLRRMPALCVACQDTGWEQVENEHEPTTRVRKCGCVELRRLEILGRRPMPALPEAS